MDQPLSVFLQFMLTNLCIQPPLPCRQWVMQAVPSSVWACPSQADMEASQPEPKTKSPLKGLSGEETSDGTTRNVSLLQAPPSCWPCCSSKLAVTAVLAATVRMISLLSLLFCVTHSSCKVLDGVSNGLIPSPMSMSWLPGREEKGVSGLYKESVYLPARLTW